MNKLTVIVPFYKRHELTALCFKRLKAQSKKFGFDVITAGSEGEESKKLAEGYGFKYIETDNNPLSEKLNILIAQAKDCDGAILIGSDDFLSDSIFKLYQELDLNKEIVYSFNDVHLYSCWDKKLVTGVRHFRGDKPIGVGRLFSKKALDKLNYRVWYEIKQGGLDSSSFRWIKANNIEDVTIAYEGHFMVDVKQTLNLTSPRVIEFYEKEVPVKGLEVLGAIHKDILKLKPEGEKQISKSVKGSQRKIKPMKKVRALVLRSFHQYKEGISYEFKEANFKQLKKLGFLTDYVAPKKAEPKKVVAKKPAVKKAVAKKPTRKTTKKSK